MDLLNFVTGILLGALAVLSYSAGLSQASADAAQQNVIQEIKNDLKEQKTEIDALKKSVEEIKNEIKNLKNGGGKKSDDNSKHSWTVIMRREDGFISFKRKWITYKKGFGDPTGEFWYGNEKLHQLTKDKHMILRIDMWQSNGDYTYGQWTDFYIKSEYYGYKLHVSKDYTGNLTRGDRLNNKWERVNGQMFSTYDRDNDAWQGSNCSELRGYTGWWYGSCGDMYLTRDYPYRDATVDTGNGVYAKKIEMKVRQK